MGLPLNAFARKAAEAVATILAVDPADLPVTSPPKPEMGDFAVGCFPAARTLKMAPPALAKKVVDEFEPTPWLAEAVAAGPFVNFRARRDTGFRRLFDQTLAASEPLVPITHGSGKTVCVDFSSPNISKHLAYHHIRSTVIGHALVNLHRALGYRVIGINHLGDWGTTHGQLIAAYKRWGAPDPLTVSALNDLYVRFSKLKKEDPALEAEGRAWFKKLEDGDAEARQLWQTFRDVSLAEFDTVYKQLSITFEEIKGESEFVDAMPEVLKLLADKGLSSESEGALVVALEDLNIPPLLLRKQDGATLYGTRDLAAAWYRHRTYDFDRSLYVVDRGQSLHFKQLFATLSRAGFDWADKCQHVPFGLVRIGGKKTGTRAGNVVLLKDVLAEARERAADRVRSKNPDMDAKALEDTARVVGVGAIVFANLASQRDKDVDFDWDDVLSTEGDSGPYVQYAHARCSSVLSKAGIALDNPGELATADPSLLTTDHEWAVARALSDLPDIVARSTESNEPHIVSRYLLDLVATYSRWYTSGNGDSELRVLCEDAATQKARLALVAGTRQVLRYGLGLLGIDAPDTM